MLIIEAINVIIINKHGNKINNNKNTKKILSNISGPNNSINNIWTEIIVAIKINKASIYKLIKLDYILKYSILNTKL